MIPAAVHAAITANAEKLLFALKRISHEIELVYDPSRAPKPTRSTGNGTGNGSGNGNGNGNGADSGGDARRGVQHVPRMNLPPMTPNSQRLAGVGPTTAATGGAPNQPISPRQRAAMRLGMSVAVNSSSPNIPRAALTPGMTRLTPSLSRVDPRNAKTPTMQRLVIKGDEEGDGGDGGVFTLLDEL